MVSASTVAATQESEAPEERFNQTADFLRLNFLSVLGGELTAQQAGELAERTLQRNQAAQQAFLDHLEQLRQSSRADPAWPDRSRLSMPQPVLSNWPLAHIQTLSETHGGLLLALFHFGAHRFLIADLAAQGVALTAPVTEQSRSAYSELAAETSTDLSENLDLLSVSEPSVGRQLLRGLRRGRVGAIYADGDMGPASSPNSSGDDQTEVAMLSARVRVKTGIARLARALRLPILPLFAAANPLDPSTGRVEMGHMLTVQDCQDNGVQWIMGELYSQLAAQVQNDPAAWEFAAFMHRWVVHTEADSQTTALRLSDLPAGARLKLDQRRVAPLRRGQQMFLVDTRQGKGFRLPETVLPILAPLSRDEGLSLQCLEQWFAQDQQPLVLRFLEQLLAKELLVTTA